MYLGLDLGTSGLKGLVVDADGVIIKTYTAPIKIIRIQSGWSEQNPSDWVQATKDVFTALREYLPNIKAVGLSGQMHGATCLDKNGEVIYPSILWNDTRSNVEAEWLNNKPIAQELTGNLVFSGFTAPKLLWMQKHRPELFARVDKVLLPKDYLRYWLTGEYVSEMSDASGTSWLNVKERDWSDQMLGFCQLSRSNMPRLIEGCQASGHIKDDIAATFGFNKNIVVAGGAGDNASVAIGLGIEKEGEGFFSLGTSGVVFGVTNSYLPNPKSALHTFCYALPKIWHQMGVTLSAADCLSWLTRVMNTDVQSLLSLAEKTKNGKVQFLPFLGGERTPYNNVNLRASFTHMGHRISQGDLVRALLEGVIFSLQETVLLMNESNLPLEKLYLVGGGAKSDYWSQLTANILQKPMLRPEKSEHEGALGAARLSALAINQDIVIKQNNHIFEPDPNQAGFYKDKFNDYLESIVLK